MRFAERDAAELRRKLARVEEENDGLELQLRKMASKSESHPAVWYATYFNCNRFVLCTQVLTITHAYFGVVRRYILLNLSFILHLVLFVIAKEESHQKTNSYNKIMTHINTASIACLSRAVGCNYSCVCLSSGRRRNSQDRVLDGDEGISEDLEELSPHEAPDSAGAQ